MAEFNVPGNVTEAAVVATSRALVEMLLNKLTVKDGRIHAEDAISAAAAVVAERCIVAAGEFDPRRHQFTPGSRVFSDQINGLISGDQPTVNSAAACSVVGVLRDQLLAAGLGREEFPDLKGVFEGFAARIGKEEDWGWVPLSTPADNRPHLMPLMVAYETRTDVDRVLAAVHHDKAKALAASTLALADILGKVKDVIDHRVALLLAIETVNGMAKTAPMTDEAYQKVGRVAAPASSPAPSRTNTASGWRRFLPWGRGSRGTPSRPGSVAVVLDDAIVPHRLPPPPACMLRRYDWIDLVEGIAAIQLIPQNAKFIPSLRHVTASICEHRHAFGSRHPTTAQLQACLRGLEPAGVLDREISAHLFVEPFFFQGLEDWLVFPGQSASSPFELQQACRAVVLQGEDRFPAGWRTTLAAAVRAALAASTMAARCNGLRRYTRCVSGEDGLVVPPEAEFDRMRGSLVLQPNDLGVGAPHIKALVAVLGDAGTSTDFADASESGMPSPVVRVDEGVLLIDPHGLLLALVASTFRSARRGELIDEFTSAFTDQVWVRVLEALKLMRWENVVHLRDAAPNTRDAVFQFDHDKVAYVGLTIDVDGLADAAIAPAWTAPSPADRAESVLRNAIKHAAGPVELLSVELSLGPTIQAGDAERTVDATTAARISMDAESLVLMGLLEVGHPRTLYQLARAERHLLTTSRLMAMAQLAPYAFYRQHKDSFYLGDDALPSMVMMTSDFEEELRFEIASRRDVHAGRHWRPGMLCEVVRAHESPRSRRYFQMTTTNEVAALAVETDGVLTWVRADTADATDARSARCLRFVDMVSFWLEQLILVEPQLLPELLPPDRWRAIDVLADGDDDAWQERATNTPRVEMESDPSRECVVLKFHPSFMASITAEDNAAEREFLVWWIGQLVGLADAPATERWPADRIARLVEAVAPLGPRRTMHVFQTNETPRIDPRDLPRVPRLEKAEAAVVLDWLGPALTLPVGDIPAADVNAVLHRAVDLIYERLASKVVPLQGINLLKRLIALHEADVRESEFWTLTYPSRRACFFPDGGLEVALSEELPERAQLGVSLRFLIEYVATKLPSGDTLASDGTIAELLAHASEIVNHGMESDYSHYGVIPARLAMLASGRLGHDRDAMEGAHKTFALLHAQGELERTTTVDPGGMYGLPADFFNEERQTEVETACEAEFGVSLAAIEKVLISAWALDSGGRYDVRVMAETDFIAAVSAATGLAQDDVARVLKCVTLESRPDFLKPPPPFVRADVLPWKFSRSLSYLFRPLIRVVSRELGDGPHILWGPRQAIVSRDYWLQSCMRGRISDRTPQMRKWVGGVNHARGERFNDRAANVFRRIAGAEVRQRVTSVGGEALGRLGDIDVLVVEPVLRRVAVVEAKDLAAARTAAEISNEMKAIVQGTGKRPSAVTRVGDRVAWISARLPKLLVELGLDPGGEWSVEPAIVTGFEAMAPLLASTSVPVLALFEVRDAVARGTDWLARAARRRTSGELSGET